MEEQVKIRKARSLCKCDFNIRIPPLNFMIILTSSKRKIKFRKRIFCVFPCSNIIVAEFKM